MPLRTKARRKVASWFLVLILKPTKWHEWLDYELDLAHIANRSVWSSMGVRMLSVYEWLYGPDDEDLGDKWPKSHQN